MTEHKPFEELNEELVRGAAQAHRLEYPVVSPATPAVFDLLNMLDEAPIASTVEFHDTPVRKAR